MNWLDVYRAYDDDALALAANPGLVRRAARLLADDVPRWQGEPTAAEGTVDVGGVAVRLDGKGLTAARCPCPTSGVCLHVVAAAMFARAAAGTSAPASDGGLASLDTQAVCRAAGIAVVRRVRKNLTPSDTADLTWDGPRLTISWPGHRVVYLADAGFAGMLSDAPATSRPEVHLEALWRAFNASGLTWTWPAAVEDEIAAAAAADQGVTPSQVALLEDVRRVAGDILGLGLTHCGPDTNDSLAGLVTAARVAGLPLLSRQLGAAAGRLQALTDRRDDVTEPDVMTELAAAWALTRALEAAGPDAFPRLRGQVRRDFTDAPTELALVPLGAYWWVGASGARGITLAVWDADAGEVRTATTARPAGVDAGFTASLDVTFWGKTLRTILGGPLTLRGPRLAVDGSLSPSVGQVVWPEKRAFSQDALRAVAGSSDALAPPRFGQSGPGLVLLAPDRRDPMTIDEPRQQLVWTLIDAAGRRVDLRQDVALHTETRLNNLLALDQLPVSFVLAHGFEPVSVFVADPLLRVVTLDFEVLPAPKTSLMQRFTLWRKRGASAMPVSGASAPARLAADVRDLLVEVAATGRRRFSPAQRQRCQALASRSGTLALATMERALLATCDDLTPDNVLRLWWLADRLTRIDEREGNDDV